MSHGRVGKDPTKQERKVNIMKMKRFLGMILLVFMLVATTVGASAATHVVRKGESLWRIAVNYQIGLSEIKEANPSIKNFDLIYPGQLINIPETDASVAAFESEVVHLVNKVRSENGLQALKQDWQLARVARYKSQDMRNLGYFSHTSPTYGSPFEMMKSFGISYRTAGENIAKGYATPHAVVNAWMNSPGHRANILNSAYTHIGVGYVKDGNYWTQMFRS